MWFSAFHEMIQDFIKKEGTIRKKEEEEAAAVEEGPVECLLEFSSGHAMGRPTMKWRTHTFRHL